MDITPDNLKFYEKNGYLLLPACFSKTEIEILKAALISEFMEDSERRVLEKNQGMVRSVYGSHMFNKEFNRLSRHPRVVQPAKTILDSEVYIYQFKINAKMGFGGDIWQWHQDYIFWLKEDGLPTDRIITVAIFLNDITRFNAPLFLIPGSHREGVIDVPARELNMDDSYSKSSAWISNLTADLKYSLDKEVVASLIRRHGIFSAEGPSGSLLFFHSNIVHGSTNNISPFDRFLILISYNSADNTPRQAKSQRPEFLVGRNSEPIVPLEDDALIT